MARYVVAKDSLFQDSFLNIDEAQNHAMEKFEAKLINGKLCDKIGDKKSLMDFFENNRFKLERLKNLIELYGIVESELIDIHIEDGQLVITLKDGNQKKIKYERSGETRKAN